MKRPLDILASLAILATLLSGCGGMVTSSATLLPATPTSLSASASPAAATSTATLPAVTPTLVSTPTSVPVVQNTQYQIQASFDYYQHTLTVSQQVVFSNPGPDAYDHLIFAVEANLEQGVFTLKSVSLGEDQPITGYTLARNSLDIALTQPMPVGATGSVSFSFELNLPAIPPPSDTTRPVVFGYSDRQTNLVDWFPTLAPYLQGTGWVIHDPGYYGEHQVYPVADFDVTLTPVNPPADLKIAAPGPDSGSPYHYVLDNARTFSWSASPYYHVASQSAGEVTVTSYNFPLDDAAAKMALQNTADAVNLYSRLYGPYQHSTLTVVEADFLDGMEYDGLYFLSKGFYNLYDGTTKGYLTAIAVHETSHQWWFGQVANDQALEPWLDEALATYSEELFYENASPDLSAWWWGFRVDFYQPIGYINQTIYDYGGFTPYRNAVYLRGAQFIDALRKQIGDAAFFAFLKDYVATEKFKIATAADFFTILSRHTGKDLTQLKADYLK